MSGPWAAKFTEIAYFIIPLAFIIVGIVIWEKRQKKKKTKDD
tara:strand:+ start:10657 stop:10782 length:126 start_codon:yes stop_codon:yes gene_type:complete